MSQDQLTLLIMMFGAVIVISVVAISVAVVIRRKRFGRRAEGPGSPNVAVSSDAWQRFGPALAAVYARREWHSTRGAKRSVTPEQTYFGYACVLPPPELLKSLARDWRVRKPQDAEEQVWGSLGRAVAQAVQLTRARGEDPADLLARLAAAGAPHDAANEIAARAAEEATDANADPQAAEEMLPSLAFDLARFANLVRWCGADGLLTHADAREASDMLGTVAVTAFGSWDAFGENYVRGLQAYSRRGNRPYVDAVEWLRTEAGSPWRALPWPGGA